MELKLNIDDLVRAVGSMLEYRDKAKDKKFMKLVGELVVDTLEDEDTPIQEVVDFMAHPRILADHIADNSTEVRRILNELDARKMLIEGDLEVYVIDRRQALPIATDKYHLPVDFTQPPITSVDIEVINVKNDAKIEFEVEPSGITMVDGIVSTIISETVIRERKALGL